MTFFNDSILRRFAETQHPVHGRAGAHHVQTRHQRPGAADVPRNRRQGRSVHLLDGIVPR